MTQGRPDATHVLVHHDGTWGHVAELLRQYRASVGVVFARPLPPQESPSASTRLPWRQESVVERGFR